MKTIKKRNIEITERDKKVIQLISNGLTDDEIAKELELSHGAIRGIINYLYCKLGVVNKPHLVAWGFKNKICK